MKKELDSEIWGPPFWFFLHTITICYPEYPNTVIKKKYYDFVQNIPLFIPVERMSSYFTFLLNKYPVAPYLDSRKSFILWMHFIHNKINEKLEKPQISLKDFYKLYYENYKPKIVKNIEYYKIKEKLIYLAFITTILIIVYYLYKYA